MRAKCPECGIPTVPDHEDLRYEDMLCDKCAERAEKFCAKCGNKLQENGECDSCWLIGKDA